MTPPHSETVDLTTIAISLGRLETKIDHLQGLESRLRNVEEAVTRIDAGAKPRTPWYSVAGGISGILAGLAVALSFLTKLL